MPRRSSSDQMPEVSMDLIQTHQGAALLALVFMEITGAFALIGLWQFSRAGKESDRPAGRLDRSGRSTVFNRDLHTHGHHR
jgi:hypothetical protein